MLAAFALRDLATQFRRRLLLTRTWVRYGRWLDWRVTAAVH